MEYCITVLVEAFQPSSAFQEPDAVNTAWGAAVRADKVGRYFWTEDLYVQPHEPVAQLYRYLPVGLRGENWVFLKVGGSGIKHFERKVNALAEQDSILNVDEEPFLLLFKELLGKQAHWAVVFEKNCGQIAEVFSQSLPGLYKTIVDAFRWDNDAAQGFCSVSPQQEVGQNGQSEADSV